MQYEVVYSKRFLKSLIRVKQWRGFRAERLREVITVLSCGEVLHERYRDHALKGDLVGFRECHIAPDILLIYCLEDGVLILTLVNIGNHAQLFE
jgi:mRNA interferase YafQ